MTFPLNKFDYIKSYKDENTFKNNYRFWIGLKH
jgi:hypothetical protein